MSDREKSLVVLVEPREMQLTLEGWPGDMWLALCLLSSGECRLMPFHDNEQLRIVPRLSRHLDLAAEDVCVVPAIEGYATQPLHYSDQRRLMRLVADQPGLSDEAADYSVNYRYALDEGLAPERLLGLGDDTPAEPEPEEVEAPEPPVAKPTLRTALPSFLRRPRDQALGVSPLPGPEFRSARQIGAEEAGAETFHLAAERDGWIEIVKAGSEGSELTLTDPERIFLRQDGGAIALMREQSSLRFQVPPTRLRISASVLPARMRRLLGAHVGPVEVHKTGDFIYLHLDAPRAEVAAPPALETPAEPAAATVAGAVPATAPAPAAPPA
uniref:hypothetical protein n=1 Tax=Shimia sp. TaxID=1954381 RepID=UPI003567BB3A